MPRSLTAADRSALIRLASTMRVGSPERRAVLAGLGKSASALETVVLSALREGHWSGSPNIGEFRVVDGVIEVSVTAQVRIPPDSTTPKLMGEMVENDPKGGLRMVFEDPSLMESLPSPSVEKLPFKSLPEPAFKSLVKRMGSLSQYSNDLLIALVEGRSSGLVFDPSTGTEWGEKVKPAVLSKMVGGATGSVTDWGGGETLDVKVKGGVVRGTFGGPFAWTNSRGLTIKMDIEGEPYVYVDPKVHGIPDDIALEESKILSDLGVKVIDESRLETLPKGTPGIVEVQVFLNLPLRPLKLSDMSRKELEGFVRMMAKG